MNETTEKLIRELADKLGTTVDHLWGVLIKQAIISNSIFIALSVGALVLFGGTALANWGNLKKAFETNDESMGAWVFVWAFALFIGTLLFFVIGISDAISGVINPEYWALKKILSLR